MAILKSFVDSSDLSKEEVNALSQDFSLVPDDPRLRLPWDFSNFTKNRTRGQVAAAVAQLSDSTAWFRRSRGQIRIFDGNFDDGLSTYWPGASSSDRYPFGMKKCVKYEFDEHGQPMWSRLCILAGLTDLHPDAEALYDFLVPSAKVVEDFSRDNLFGLLPLKRETRFLRWLFEFSQIYEANKDSLQLSIEEIHVQFAWYQRGNESSPSGLLSGNLYGSNEGETLIQQTWQVRATVHSPESWTSLPDNYHTWAAKNSRWAILIAEPPRLRGPEAFYTMQITLLREIHRALHSILLEWDSIISHIQSLLSIEQAILHPELHDRLLFDEQDFSTSRKYFWIINSTEEFHRQIEETEKTYALFFKDHIEAPYEMYTGLDKNEMVELRELGMWSVLISDHETISRRLGGLLVQLNTQRDRAVGFRDGLFSASSVLESRASTRLGQNVKLLTYVSIFYLPLSFVTSIWSMSNTTLPTSSLIPTIILVAMTTYLLVFNLASISSTVHHNYLSLKQSLLHSMQNHNNSTSRNHSPSVTSNDPNDQGFWPKTAARYNHFSPPKWDPNPSEWLIFVYMVMQVGMWPGRKLVVGLRWVGGLFRGGEDLEMGTERDPSESGIRATLDVVMTEEMVLDRLVGVGCCTEK